MRWSLDAATTRTTHTSQCAPAFIANRFVAEVLAHTLLEAAEACGARMQHPFAGFESALDQPNQSFLELEQFACLIESAVAQTGDAAFGLHWGERASSTNFGIVAAVAHWAPSPRKALIELTRFQGLLIQGPPVSKFEVRGRLATLRFELDWLPHGARRAWAEFVTVGTWKLVQQLCGRNAVPPVTTFDHAAPEYVDDYRRILGDDISFDREVCSIAFETLVLDRVAPQFNERLNEAVTFEASLALARLEGAHDCSARVHEQLASGLPNVPAMDEVARKLGMSGRTLRRKLKQEGKAFPTLVAEALRDRALHLLDDPKASVKEVAYKLGFATPNAFHRAFKRWTGSSPSEARAGRVLS